MEVAATMQTVTLSFEMPESEVRRVLGEDWRLAGSGITVERVAATLIHCHAPSDGYIKWRAVDSGS